MLGTATKNAVPTCTTRPSEWLTMPATLRRVPEGTLPELSSAGEAIGAMAAKDASAHTAAAIETRAFLMRSDSSRVLARVCKEAGWRPFRRITIAEGGALGREVLREESRAKTACARKTKRRGRSFPLRPRRQSGSLRIKTESVIGRLPAVAISSAATAVP